MNGTVTDDAPMTTAQECLMVRPDFPNGVKYVMVPAEFARALERKVANLTALIEASRNTK